MPKGKKVITVEITPQNLCFVVCLLYINIPVIDDMTKKTKADRIGCKHIKLEILNITPKRSKNGSATIINSKNQPQPSLSTT